MGEIALGHHNKLSINSLHRDIFFQSFEVPGYAKVGEKQKLERVVLILGRKWNSSSFLKNACGTAES